ncbi:hypothetical protein [uncultured Roseobacter sp.]|uniref:hypothetical protein n=1 Tax=uncultured Roseobacter sp. TaxID=114847 RepID=UPI00262D52CF|nr:hypothetical protein [uncultured Roseobacter sp.]
MDKSDKPQRRFEEMFELACQFLSNSWNIWKNDNLSMRGTVLKLAFEDRASNRRKERFKKLNHSIC